MKIISQNFCLGLENKMTLARKWTYTLKPTVFIIQEAEITENTNLELLKLNGYSLHHTKIDPKSRLAVYISSSEKYKIEISNETEMCYIQFEKTDIFACYRPFKIKASKKQYVENMLSFVKKNLNCEKNVIIVGDFNYDQQKLYKPTDPLNKLFENWNAFIDQIGAIQKITVPTWFRTYGENVRSSILDLCYSTCEIVTSVEDLQIGDHMAIVAETKSDKRTEKPVKTRVRYWSKYRPNNFQEILDEEKILSLDNLNVETHALLLANEMMNALEKLAPEISVKQKDSNLVWSEKLLKIRRKKNNMLKKARKKNRPDLILKCRTLDKEFKKELEKEKRTKIINKIGDSNGDNRSFWKAVNLAKNGSYTKLPKVMYEGTKMANNNRDIAGLFADFFQKKMSETGDTPTGYAYNGSKLLHEPIDIEDIDQEIEEVIKEINTKTCFGDDRVPQRLYKDGGNIIKISIKSLFKKIIKGQRIPESWKVSRIIPVHKKNKENEISNYRPISNLCSLAKIFERIVLKLLEKIAFKNNIDLTSEKQYGFKKGCGTDTLLLYIQNEIAKALEQKQLCAIVSLDLTAAFDVVDRKLLLKRLKILGIQKEVLDLLENWFDGRSAYVEIETESSRRFDLNMGTIQGSVLGPVMFALFIRPILISQNIVAYADDNYVIETDSTLDELCQKIENKTKIIEKWFTESGLVVNLDKTEFVIFKNKGLTVNKEITINKRKIKCKGHMKILGIIVDEHLGWSNHLDEVFKKVKRSCAALRQIAKYIPQTHMMTVATAYAYSILYYGSSVWLGPHLAKPYWKRLKSISSLIIRSALGLMDWHISFDDLHVIGGRALPKAYMKYTNLVMLKRVLDTKKPIEIYNSLINNITVNERTNKAYIKSISTCKVSDNIFEIRLKPIIKEIDYRTLNFSKEVFKQHCKKKLLR